MLFILCSDELQLRSVLQEVLLALALFTHLALCVLSFYSYYLLTSPTLTPNCFTGAVPSDAVLEKMVKEIPSGSVNFTAFLSMFSDKLTGKYKCLNVT